jgi:putative ABC transport system permease protein
MFDQGSAGTGKEVEITLEMLFNPVVFGTALTFCILLNFISALIPTVWALRHSIINSIHSKR